MIASQHRTTLAAATLLAAALWWLWPDSAPEPVAAAPETPVAQAERAAQPWPFAAGAPAQEQASSAFPWDHLSATTEEEEPPAEVADAELDPRTLNAGIDPSRLSVHQPQAARALLDHVALAPEPRGGFVVQAVLPGSRYERAGLRVGDIIQTLDLPEQLPVEETMISLMLKQELAFDVIRASALVRLSVRLGEDAQDPA